MDEDNMEEISSWQEADWIEPIEDDGFEILVDDTRVKEDEIEDDNTPVGMRLFGKNNVVLDGHITQRLLPFKTTGVLKAALHGDTVYTLMGREIEIIPRDVAEFKVQHGWEQVKGGTKEVTILQVPDDIAAVLSVEDYPLKHKTKPFDWARWFVQYREDCEKVSGKVLDNNIRSFAFMGRLGQLVTDPRLMDRKQLGFEDDDEDGYEEIGLATEDYLKLRPKKLKEGQAPSWYWLRNPVTVRGIGRARVLHLPDREPGHIYVPQSTLREDRGGDEDGDGGGAIPHGEPLPDRTVGSYPIPYFTGTGSFIKDMVARWQ